MDNSILINGRYLKQHFTKENVEVGNNYMKKNYGQHNSLGKQKFKPGLDTLSHYQYVKRFSLLR